MADSIYKSYRPGDTSELYLKLRDGDNVKLRIYSEPAIVVYKAGQRPRYAWVVINHENKRAQVFNGGVSIYNQIADLVEDWGSPTEFDIRIKRTGSGQFDTEYSVTPVKVPTAPTKEQEAEADKIDLLNATKGKWLADYLKDNTLPDPISDEAVDEVVPMPADGEDISDMIDPDNIPF